MEETDVLSRHDLGDGIIEVQLGRSPVNALSADFLMQFADEMESISKDEAIKAVILTSPFKAFSAGLDLKQAQNFDIAQQHAVVRGLNEAFLALYACPKPVVASVGGPAIAGGLFFVLASDRRVALSKRSSFGLAEVRVGADFPVGPLEIAKATLDSDTQRRLMLTGQPIGPIAARNAGFIDIIAEDLEDLVAYSLSEARKLAELPSEAYASIKLQLRAETIARIRAAIAAGGNEPQGGWFNSQTRDAMQRMIDQG